MRIVSHHGNGGLLDANSISTPIPHCSSIIIKMATVAMVRINNALAALILDDKGQMYKRSRILIVTQSLYTYVKDHPLQFVSP